MLKKILSYINFFNEKKTVFPISEKFKARKKIKNVFVIISFFSFRETYLCFIHFKDFLNLHYKMKYEAKLRKFFSLNFQGLQHDI